MKEIYYEGIKQLPREFLENRTVVSSFGKGNSGAEEILHRIMRFCLEKNKWVAPTGGELYEQAKVDLDQLNEAEAIHRRNQEKRCAYEKASKWNWFRRLFGKEIMEPEYEEEKKLPSFIFKPVNQVAFDWGIMYMRKNGFLELFEENGEIYFRATEKALLAMHIVR